MPAASPSVLTDLFAMHSPGGACSHKGLIPDLHHDSPNQ